MAFNIGSGLLSDISKSLKDVNAVNVRIIPPEQIVESEYNDSLSMEGLDALQASIEDVGLKQLPSVAMTEEGQYRIIAGHRRIRAIKQSIAAGNSRYADGIPCMIEDFSLIDLPVDAQTKELYVWATTNTESRELTMSDKLALKKAMDSVYNALAAAGKKPQGARRAFVAEKMKISETQAQRLDVITKKLIKPFQDHINFLALTTAEEIAKLPESQQEELFLRYAMAEISFDLVKAYKEEKQLAAAAATDRMEKTTTSPYGLAEKPKQQNQAKEPAGTDYLCKCGKKEYKSTQAETTGNRLLDYNEDHPCWGCPYVCKLKSYDFDSHSTKISGYECRMSKSVCYYTTAQLYADDKCVGRVYSLDLEMLARIKDFATDLEGIDSVSGDAARGADYTDDGRLKLTIYPSQNKMGIAAKQQIMDRFFNADGTRIDLSPEEEKDKVIAALNAAIQPQWRRYLPNSTSDNKDVLLEDEQEAQTFTRLTHERVNGIKSGYWSPATKDELIRRLAAYENLGKSPEELKSLLVHMDY